MALPDDIRDRTRACQKLFISCLSISRSEDWFENRQGDFNLWASGLNARSIGSPVQEIICDLLDGLAEALEKYLQTGIYHTPESCNNANEL